MTIYFATDHAGYELKNQLVTYVRDALGMEVVDCGALSYAAEDDYPDFIQEAARKVAEDPHHRRAIILGGSGQGEAIVANRFKGVRATVYYGGEPTIITLGRQHNDTNVLSLGARFLSVEEAKRAVTEWLSTDFTSEERHVRRITKIDAL